jgi:corrinoid protein of di/trimethylamine methyltransferase
MSNRILENLKKAIMEGHDDEALIWAKRTVEERIDPIKVVDELAEVMRQVGESFGRGELFLVDLSLSATAMKAAMPPILEEMKKSGRKMNILGTVIIGTVAGDVHDIGKNIVTTLLSASGFEVNDLGVDVPVEKFVKAVREHEHDILAMSALLTSTALEMDRVVSTLKNENLKDRVNIMIGGGAITQRFAEKIGADGYGSTALDAVELAKRFIGMNR